MREIQVGRKGGKIRGNRVQTEGKRRGRRRKGKRKGERVRII